MSKLVVITNNLMDASKIQASVPDAEAVRSLDSPTVARAGLILLDLETGLDPTKVVAIGPPVIAYGPHLDAAALEAAVASGCQDALPRSKLFQDPGRVMA